jgi:8-oxo-dGTP pyrophosphatase MutT (NUDIX family)
MVSYTFDAALRRRVADLFAAFVRERPSMALAGLKRAAVAITLVEADPADKAAAVLLTRRAAKMRTHRGQWALPGGRCNENETEIDAALRELHEELGLGLGRGDVLGVLDDYPTRSGFLITPVVVWANSGAPLDLNPAEVASVHRIPLEQIMRPDAVDFVSIPESDRHVVRLHVNGRFIHAPTAALLYQFREVLEGRATRVAHLEQPVFAWR